jgi:hypothetical protein
VSARPWPAPLRALGREAVVAGPGARLARLSAEETRAAREGAGVDGASAERLAPLGVLPGPVDVDALARDLVATGVLNWAGPATHALVVSGGGAAMTPETARDAVDFAFSTPRPTLHVEIVDEDGRGFAAGWFAVEYARRKAEWRRRGLALSWRVRGAPTPELSSFLAGHRAAATLEVVADGSPARAPLFAAARARVVVAPGARDPEGWVDALSGRGLSGVQWRPPAAAFDSIAAARRFALFAARALARMIETHAVSDLRDERAVALLSARPWEVPGTELLETLAYAPDGGVYASEDGWRRALGGDSSRRLGACAELRYQELGASPLARAIVAAAWRPAHPVCADCPYRGVCAIPLTGGGAGAGVLGDPWCLLNTALLDVVFRFPDREKCLKALEKWGVDISRTAC